ncbi:hypothetical protein K466DRAFT_659999 [Polyporus arcularius HHB13444]|uniref:F-box domain-containing protein n=1 Tax=Polyporus arcularius HHB13444 TaxID=1314778 RepID=A0A5C3PPB4_9APHY|nr:hypothetical protein K466DRAFT_659999 [Polyporus arcularius HHB13444]
MVPHCPPVLSLPVEVWFRILEYVPDPENKDGIWLSSMADTAMLLPMSQTCRHFRDLTFSHPALWQSVKIGAGPKARRLAEDAITRSRLRSLKVDILPLSSESGRDVGWMDMRRLWPEVAARCRELHLVVRKIKERADPLWDPMFDHSYPRLEFFSFCDATLNSTPFPPFSQGLTSHLRHLHLRFAVALPRCEFPRITHLALEDVHASHADIIGLLGRCSNLESLIIRKIRLTAIPNAAWDEYPDISKSLPHLRRVLLQELRDPFLPFYLYKIPKHPHGYSLQVVGVTAFTKYCDAGAILSYYSGRPVKTVHIGLERSRRNPTESTDFYAPSVAFFGPQSVVRVGTVARLAGERCVDGPDWLRHTLRDKSALQSVSDVWVVSFRPSWWDAFEEPLRDNISGLPALEVVTIVMDQSRYWGEPDLRILPDGRDPVFDSHRLKTARLVYAYDREVEYRRAVNTRQYGDLLKPRETKQLSLSKVLEQLKTGAFDYLDRLVLHVTPRFAFDDAELAELRGYVPQVDIECSDETLRMPLPEYAREPEASGCLEYWYGAFH